MASTHKHLRSSTADKRPTTAIADGQIALNTNTTSPGLYFKDSTGASIIKVGPVHVGTTAPNATPPSGGSSGNSTGEVWLDTSLTPPGVKIWNGSAWVNATPVGSTTVQGLLELATDAETQAGSDAVRAVTPAGLQSKVSDSISTTSSTTIASSTAVKTAYDLANAALPLSGGTVTGNLEIGTTGSLSFEGSVADGFETTIAVTDPTADRTITLPDTTGTVVTTGDTGTVTSTMIANGTIIDADINASAAIAGTKISPDFGAQNVTTTGTSTAASFIPTSSTVPTNGVYLPAANSVGISTNGGQRLLIDSAGQIEAAGLGTAAAPSWSYVGDPNTGTFSPGADTWAISTGGSERLRVSSTGLVGIGTSSPDATLSVVGGPSVDGANFPSGNLIGSFSSNTGDAELITFGNQSLNASTFTMAFVPRRAGSVGAQQGWYQKIDSTSAAAGSYTLGTLQRASSGGAPETPRFHITSAGLVGIGTSDTSLGNLQLSGANGVTLAVKNTTGTLTGTEFCQITLNNTNNSSGNFESAKIKAISTNGGANLAHLTFENSGTERARIDSSGRLLVGTSSALANVYYSSSATAPSFQLEGSGVATSSFSLTNTSASNGGTLALQTGSSGNTPVENATLGILQFNGFDGTNYRNAARVSAAVDGTPGTADMPGRLVFSTSSDGASSPTERLRITSTGQVRLAGAGITFNGDTATANELDDYEEGTFTPTMIGATTAGAGTYSVQVGRYTKIGRVVHFYAYLIWSAHTGTGSARVDGLPFTSLATSGTLSAITVRPDDWTLTANNVMIAYQLSNTTQILIQQYPVGGGSATSVTLDTAASIMVSGHYIVS